MKMIVILIAKNNAAHQKMAAQFEARTVEKEYWAIVHKIPDRDRDVVTLPIGPHPHHREKMITGENIQRGKAAETFYEVLERFSSFALVRLVPKTGRTHQIRIHCEAGLGLPLLGDPVYGNGATKGAAPRTMLHAAGLTVTREGKTPIEAVAPLPPEFAALGFADTAA